MVGAGDPPRVTMKRPPTRAEAASAATAIGHRRWARTRRLGGTATPPGRVAFRGASRSLVAVPDVSTTPPRVGSAPPRRRSRPGDKLFAESRGHSCLTAEVFLKSALQETLSVTWKSTGAPEAGTKAKPSSLVRSGNVLRSKLHELSAARVPAMQRDP